MSDNNVMIIAEIGNMHEGSLELAQKLIQVSAECGSDAVKFQTHIFECESLEDAPNPPYFQKESRKSYFERCAFTIENYRQLKSYAEEKYNIEFMSSPFSEKAVDLLEEINIKRYKIPSGEVSNTPLLEKIAKIGKPVLLSSGMSSWAELDQAVKIFHDNSCPLTILQCTSIYPCPVDKAGIGILEEYKKRYHCEVGFSDHTLGCAASIGAVMLGARVIEKHLILTDNMYGSDAIHSLTPDRFKAFVSEIKDTQKALTFLDKDELAKELKPMKHIFEKSIIINKELPEGANIKREDIDFKKPGDGVGANEYQNIINKRLRRSVKANTKISWEDVSE